jgi:hypothetical protein
VPDELVPNLEDTDCCNGKCCHGDKQVSSAKRAKRVGKLVKS